MKQIIYILTLITFGASLTVQGQNYSTRWTMGEERAKQTLGDCLIDSVGHNVVGQKILLRDKKDAIKFAEPILFDIYGKREIRKQRPYEAYNFDNYWIISGTLPKNWKGGTFLIIINSVNYRIVKITHGK